MSRFPRVVLVFILLAGAVTALCTWLGSIRVGIAAGLAMTVIAVLVAWSLRRQRRSDGPDRPVSPRLPGDRGSRRRAVRRRGCRARSRRPEARPTRRGRRPGGGGHRHRRRVHGARGAGEPPGALGGTPAAPGAVQQRELRVRIPEPASAGPAHVPRRGVDVPRTRPAHRLRARRDRAGRLHRARVPRRPRPDHREPDRLRRLAEGPRGPGAAGAAHDGHDPQGRGHLRVRRRRLERAAHVAQRLAEPQAADARGRELPQRAHGLVPRGHRVRARHDRHGDVPAWPRDHRAQHPRRRDRAQGLRHPRPGRSEGHPPADAGRPVARRDGRMGGPGRLPGVAHGHARTRWDRSARRRPARRRLLRRAGRDRMAAAQPGAVPAARGRARDGGAAGPHGDVPGSGVRPGMGTVAHRLLLRAPDRRVPGRPARGDASSTSRSATRGRRCSTRPSSPPTTPATSTAWRRSGRASWSTRSTPSSDDWSTCSRSGSPASTCCW